MLHYHFANSTNALPALAGTQHCLPAGMYHHEAPLTRIARCDVLLQMHPAASTTLLILASTLLQAAVDIPTTSNRLIDQVDNKHCRHINTPGPSISPSSVGIYRIAAQHCGCGGQQRLAFCMGMLQSEDDRQDASHSINGAFNDGWEE